jgi:diguanylate cyclase (GGDEF)-like protein
MSMSAPLPIRVLVVDDEKGVRDAYRKILLENRADTDRAAVDELRSKLFKKRAADVLPSAEAMPRTSFELTVCSGAHAAVAVVQEAVAADRPFAIAFLDMRMPPGPDGVWAATQIRALDPEIDIVLCTAYSDVDPADIGRRVPPEEKLFYLAKPFHPHEVRQTAVALGRRWHAERALAKLAYFDPLTGLPNRERFRSRLAAAIDAARRRSKFLAVLFIDLDNFKRINDTLGHSVGDELLQTMADRLREALRTDDVVGRASAALPTGGNLGRLGGDEFVVLLPDLEDPEDARTVAERVIRLLGQPLHLAQHEMVVTPSVGVSIYPRDAQDVDALLRNSDLAMYFAKQQRPGTFAVYDAPMSAGALKRLTIEGRLREALAHNEFSLHFQPQFDLATGLVAGMEALLRWTNADLGSVPPSEFIPVAEETGLIIPIGEWVLRSACATATTWTDDGGPPIRVAVNVSALQFSQRTLPALVESILKETGLEAARLELELTESLVMKDEDWTREAITAFKAIGVSVAIDDFGTGYSSFSRLRDFAVDRLKIDGSFVQNMMTRPADHAVAAAIITMAKSLGLGVVAEGVEEFPQLLSLQDQRCDQAQGYLLSRPMPASAAKAFLQRLQTTVDGSRTQRLRRLIL